jgi:hypothetical protein
MNKPSLSRALPLSKPAGPETYVVAKGAGVWPELKRVDQGDREDLEVVLRRHGRSPDEFYVSDTPSRIDPPHLGLNGVIRGPVMTDVIVRSRKTGAARAYMASSGINRGPFAEWVNQFEGDLENGLFE